MKSEIINIIADNLNIDPESITENMNLKEDLSVDSLDYITIVTELEDKYNLMFEDELIDKINTVGDLIEYIEKSK